MKTEDGVLRYYGHTKNMRVRKDKHVSDHKRWVAAGRPEKVSEVNATRSVLVLDHEDWRMDPVDEVEHDDEKKAKDKARAKEGEWILKHDCVNMCVAGRTKQESDKQYNETHKDEVKEYKKQYREAHKEENREYAKHYNETHREEQREYNKKYQATHKAEISAKRAEKVTCEVCNAVVSKRNIAAHRKTTKCIEASGAYASTSSCDDSSDV